MAKGNFIEYIVSDNPDKYPDGGEHGGYYYELFDGSGAYVWKKYNVEFVQGTSVTVTLQNDGTSINLYTIDNLYLKDDSTVGIQGDVAKTVAISSLLEGTVLGGMNPTYYAYGEDGLVYAYPRCSSDVTAITTSNPVTAEKGEFIDYVVNDNPNAFPDGDVHSDGYWYERFIQKLTPEMFGCAEMTIDEITLASGGYIKNIKFYHTLGKVPTIVILRRKDKVTTSYHIQMIIGTNIPGLTNGNSGAYCNGYHSSNNQMNAGLPWYAYNNYVMFSGFDTSYLAPTGTEWELITMA